MWRAHFIVLLGGLLWSTAGLAAERVGVITIDGAIGPATADYVIRAVKVADAQQHQCLVIQLDTPGGLLDSTKTIVQRLLASPVPTVVYVTPAGATAASAGCFITLAADVAAMAPTTTIGAAHPVAIGGAPGTGDTKVDDTMKQKLENYASTFIESIAAKRSRNVEWARASVRESASATAEHALELHVIDFVAPDLTTLLVQIDGRRIGGRILHTRGAEVITIGMSPRERVFQLLWRPEVIFVLMMIAIYGIIGELSNPGAIFPGVVGAIALILALYFGAILPINLAGVALIVFAVVLFVADIYAPTHGVLTVGGAISFFLGALMLFDTGDAAFRLSLALVLPMTILTTLFFLFVVGAGLRAQSLPVRAGRETMLGRIVPALDRIDATRGRVFVEGETWNAVSDVPVEPGMPVEIVGFDGLTLRVKPSTRESHV
ncbi:MAG TPA: nodulation protein NfeD [Opitutus sp.]|nr:nodulation protein NfeD [Opitutus sp.]